MKLPSLSARFGLATVAAFALAASALAGDSILKGLSSTAGGYSTWDADLINVEQVSQTGKGVYVAVLDTGLVPNWKDYFPADRIDTKDGTGFDQPVSFKLSKDDPCGIDAGAEVGKLSQSTWVGSTTSTHGTHVASTILGYAYRSNFDAVGGFPLPAIVVRGIAPDVTVIPVRVLADYQVPARPHCPDPALQASGTVNFGTSGMIAAGIRYATNLKLAGYSPMVINMSLGGPELDPEEKAAIDYAIANGDLKGRNPGNFYYVGGTSMATPHVVSVAALMLQKNPALTQSAVEWILKSSALPLSAAGSRAIFDSAAPAMVTWDTDCDGAPAGARDALRGPRSLR